MQIARSAASTTSKVRKLRLGLKVFNLGGAARAALNRAAVQVAQDYSSGYNEQGYNASPNNLDSSSSPQSLFEEQSSRSSSSRSSSSEVDNNNNGVRSPSQQPPSPPGPSIPNP